MIKNEIKKKFRLFYQGFKNMVFLNVIMGFRVDGNWFGKLLFKGGDQMFFTAVEELSNFRMNPDSKSVSHDITGF